VTRSGTDATIIAVGRMVPEAMAAAAPLAEAGIEVEVIDVRTVQPLDSATILDSVRRTNRALVVHEAVTFGGIGAEISSQIQEEAFDYLDAPVARVSGKDVPMPYAANLEKLALPSVAEIVDAAKAVSYR
jgi:pyruvate dehydrogenase E1 component beta subunit